MKAARLLAIVLVGYVALVAAFESLIGVLQPEGGSTLVITTTGEDGARHDRVVSRLEVDGRLYVAANHWPRAWYERALERPEVDVTLEGERSPYRAVPVAGEEHAQVEAEHGLGLGFRFLTGFPPRYFLRLDPR